MLVSAEAKNSRIGKNPICLPPDITLELNGNSVKARGPMGEQTIQINKALSVSLEGREIRVTRNNDDKRTHQLHGLNRTLLNNMLIGVSKGYEKQQTLVGVGFRVKVDGRRLIFSVGFSHDVIVNLPRGIDATVTQNTKLSITGIDKSEVGNFAAKLRRIRPPEPYGGKGIRYSEEKVKLKEGKTGKK